MTGNIYITKYEDPSSPIFNFFINTICIPNTLIDLGVSINIMTRETIEKLGLIKLRQTPTILELADRSTI